MTATRRDGDSTGSLGYADGMEYFTAHGVIWRAPYENALADAGRNRLGQPLVMREGATLVCRGTSAADLPAATRLALCDRDGQPVWREPRPSAVQIAWFVGWLNGNGYSIVDTDGPCAPCIGPDAQEVVFAYCSDNGDGLAIVDPAYARGEAEGEAFRASGTDPDEPSAGAVSTPAAQLADFTPDTMHERMAGTDAYARGVANAPAYLAGMVGVQGGLSEHYQAILNVTKWTDDDDTSGDDDTVEVRPALTMGELARDVAARGVTRIGVSFTKTSEETYRIDVSTPLPASAGGGETKIEEWWTDARDLAAVARECDALVAAFKGAGIAILP